MLHGHPIALEKEVLRRRIYAPLAYEPVRDTALVPIVHSECLALAARFPLVWRRDRDRTFTFVAVRALLNAQGCQPATARAILPLILHAYPFMFDPAQPFAAASRRMLDDVFADQPTDGGAAITTLSGKLGRATTLRLRLLDRIANEHDVTQAVTDALAAHDLLEPWPLSFTIEGRAIAVPDLFVVRPAAFDGPSPGRLTERFGMPCAQMLALHRASLFCAGPLLAAARLYLKASRAEAEDRDAGPRDDAPANRPAAMMVQP